METKDQEILELKKKIHRLELFSRLLQMQIDNKTLEEVKNDYKIEILKDNFDKAEKKLYEKVYSDFLSGFFICNDESKVT